MSRAVTYVRAAIETEFYEYTKHIEKRQAVFGDHQVETSCEMRTEEEHPFSKGSFIRFDPGVGVVVRPDGAILIFG